MLQQHILDNLEKVKQSCLVFDIETSAHDNYGREVNISRDFEKYLTCAIVKWVGFYSFKNNQHYLINALENPDLIRQIMEDHEVLVGHNSEEFDYEIMRNNNLLNPDKRYLHVDLMQIFGNSTFKNKQGQKYKGRGALMGYKFKNSKLRHMAEIVGVETQKGDIDYKIFHKNSWTKEEQEEIEKYLKADIFAEKELFEKLWEYWFTFTEYIDEKYIYNLSWIRSSIASLTYISACNVLQTEPTYGEYKDTKEDMGGHVILPTNRESKNVYYLDFTSLYPHIFAMFNLFAETSNKENGWHGNDVFKVKGYYDTLQEHPLAKRVKEFLKQRIDLKKNDPESPLIYTIKIWLNTLYGLVRSCIFEKMHTENAGWDCCWLGQQLQKLSIDMMNEFGFETIAGDSITGDCILNYEDLSNKTVEEEWNQNLSQTIIRNGKEIKKWYGKNVLTCNNSFKNYYATPTEIIRHKTNKKIYEVKLSSQESIKITEDHSLIGVDENNNYIEVKPEDIISKKIKYVLFNRNNICDNVSLGLQRELYNLMGMIVANGNIENSRILLSYEFIDEYYDKIIKKINDDFRYVKRTKKTDVGLHSKELAKKMANLGFCGNSKSKRIPKWLFNESEENICLFLNGCMSGDGTVCLKPCGSLTIRYTSINNYLIKDIQKLFMKVGIASSIIKESKENCWNKIKTGTYTYHLTIIDKQRFVDKVGFTCKNKNDKIKNKLFKQKTKILKDKASCYHKKNGYMCVDYDNYKKDFCFRNVLSVKEIKYTDYVYDISVPETEKFYANNILVHNTDSFFVIAKDEKFNNIEYVKECLNKIIKVIFDNVPFPVETFEIAIEDYIDYILYPTPLQELQNEKGENIKQGKRIVWVRKGLKKNYLYISKKKNKETGKLEDKIIIKGLPIIKDTATPLGVKIFKEVLEPLILKNKSAIFKKEFIEEIIQEYIKKPEILELLATEYKVQPEKTYKPDKKGNYTNIYAQISKGYFNGQEGVINLIKNNKVGKAGKGCKYCTVQEAIDANLTTKDLDLEKVYNELDPFIEINDAKIWVKEKNGANYFFIAKEEFDEKIHVNI